MAWVNTLRSRSLEAKKSLDAYTELDVWISSVFYNSSLGFIKCSVLALYARLGDRQLKRMSLIVLAICAASASANVLVCIFQCWPLNAAWDQTITQKRCVNINAFYLANAATNIATDLLAYLLPMRLVKNLQIPKKQKIAVGVMLCLGLFTCVSSIIRISFIPVMLTSDDPTYVIAPPFYWSVIEINIGVLAASIPSFKPLAKRFLPRLIGESSYKGRQGYANSGSLKAHYKGNSGSGFGRLDSGNAVHMGDFKKSGAMSHTESLDHPNRLQKTGQRDPAFYNGGERTTQGSNESQHSHSSEEYIIKPGKSDIVRTTEFTRTVEEAHPHSSRGKKDFFPGTAV
ncbi:uncharacterized protein HMPREF1541_02986 [Cyphellophora europaea CBS 101466]|uniref:Rhodopsin domain-containing protein n=1 Tax=Cyphellophora europaea (strain CBS 101466) TaxID=1220924 RepID=W2RX80_CYPE1|nr:uncharacterized protein HMPREF1541_02986 [Cyphellophora europaea CBS 101466]ETN41052.1 hypothetical protein HMPREF1541_02986 [Cyphellophora europaea CBS 101466]